MSKIVRRILIAAFLLCFAGAVLIGIGTAAGGVKYFSERNQSSQFRGTGKFYEAEENLASFKNIDIRLEASDLCILPSKDGACRLSYRIYGSKKENPLSFAVEGDTLTIKEDLSFEQGYVNVDLGDMISFIGKGRDFPDENPKEGIYLYLPADYKAATVNMDSKSGDVRMKGLTADKLSLKLAYGDLVLDHVTSGRTEAAVSNGDIKAENSSLQQMSVKDSYGDVKTEDCTLSDFSAKLSNGDLKLANTTLSGANVLDLSYGDVILTGLSPDPSTISWKLKVNYGDLKLPESLLNAPGTDTHYKNDDLSEFSLQQKEAAAVSISIDSKNGDITVK